jgi:hypothetical protein
MSAFTTLLRKAVGYFAKRGFTTIADVANWRVQLAAAAESHLSTEKAQARVERGLTGAFHRWMGRGRVSLPQRGVAKFTLDMLEPKLKDELQNRMFAAREAVDGAHRLALERIHNRFMGFATAGAQPQAAREATKDIGKAARDAKYYERLTAINETARLMSALDEIAAADTGSIGGFWDATPEIKRKHRLEHGGKDGHGGRHGKFYARRGSWADREGLVRHPNGYIDEHDMPRVLINCQCEYKYVYDLADIPPELLTAKGRRAA